MLHNDVGLTPEDLALVAGDSPDLAVRARSKVVLTQSNSPELVPGDKRHVPGAQVGWFVVPSGDERVAVDHVDFIVIGFSHYYDEYQPGRGPYVDTHVNKPAAAIWYDRKRGDKVDKTGLYLPSGNRLVETILAYLVMTRGQGASFAFQGSAIPVGRDFSDRASTIKGVVGTSSVHTCTVGKWRMTATHERNGDDRWCKPAVALLGKLGEPKGPTIPEWRQAQTLRKAVKDGTSWQDALEALSAQLTAAPKPKLVEQTPAMVEPKLTAADKAKAWSEGPPPVDPDDPGYDADNVRYPDQDEVGF
jgi:hypothetical protein